MRLPRRRACLALLTVAVVATLLPVAAPASAATCPAPGGVPIPATSGPGDADFVIRGRGWGHGVGMSQYGAQGAALLGCSAARILTTYYPGAHLGTADSSGPIRVSVHTEATALRVVADTGSLPWSVCTSAGCHGLGITQPNGALWYARTAVDGTPSLDNGNKTVWKGQRGQRLRVSATDPGAPTRIIRLPFSERRYKWGAIEVTPARRGDGVWRSYVTVVVPTVELYLRGLAEMPSSWPEAALRAQAIVGRAYALHRRDVIGLRSSCRCHLYDSVYDQAYTGYGKESEGTGAYYGKRWVAAVTGTSGMVLRGGDGRLAEGYYSSSHGGASESARFTWGGDVGYLKAVDDSRWEMASANPRRTWALGISAESLGAAFGVGTATSVRLPDPRGMAGRVGRTDMGYGGVVVKGTAGTATVSGSSFRTTVNGVFGTEVILSTLFTVAAPSTTVQPTDPACAPGSFTFDSRSGRIARGSSVRMAAASARRWGAAGTVIVTGNAPEVRLPGVALAARMNAPMLLTQPASLPDATRRQLERLRPPMVYVLGDRTTVGDAVVRSIQLATGGTVRRLAGDTRYSTARRIAETAGPLRTREVVLTLGASRDPDRVWTFGASAAALASTGVPLLLTRARRLPRATVNALQALQTKKVLLVGAGTVTTRRPVADKLRSLGYGVTRIGDRTPYGTAAAAGAFVLARRPKPARVVLASVARATEPLLAPVLAARVRGVPLLVAPCSLTDSPAVSALLRDRHPGLEGVTVLGTTTRLSDRVRAQAVNLITG